MAQDYGVAEPLINMARKAYSTYTRLDKPPAAKDGPWHDEMVRKANASFQPRPAVKRVPKRTPMRTAAQKRR